MFTYQWSMGILMGTEKREVAKFDGESNELGIGLFTRDAMWRNLKSL
jgi:hypothetical protein